MEVEEQGCEQPAALLSVNAVVTAEALDHRSSVVTDVYSELGAGRVVEQRPRGPRLRTNDDVRRRYCAHGTEQLEPETPHLKVVPGCFAPLQKKGKNAPE